MPLENKNTDSARNKEAEARRLRALRRARMDAGRTFVTVDLPVELIELVDQVKKGRRLAGRAPVIEEALKEYLTKQHRV